jgi:molybdopterin-containing oxidoreductase family iron-sulfur binding subunit
MEDSRRNFLKIAGVSAALGLSAGALLEALASSAGGEHAAPADPKVLRGEKALSATQWAMVIDTRKFASAEDLKPIVAACHKIHNIPRFEEPRHEIKWIWEEPFHNAFPSAHNKYLGERVHHLPFLVLCNHCENPPCVRACPTQATFKREDGIVMMDFHRCIGCRFCMAACPFGARSFNFRDPRPFIKPEEYVTEFPTRMKGVVEKCNFCNERLAVGLQPACVEASKGAIVFGDLNNPESEVRALLKENYTIRRKQELGTEPAVYYIV